MKPAVSLQSAATSTILHLKLSRLNSALASIMSRLTSEVATEEEHVDFLENHLQSLKLLQRTAQRSKNTSIRQQATFTESITPAARLSNLQQGRVYMDQHEEAAIRLSDCSNRRDFPFTRLVNQVFSGSNKELMVVPFYGSKEITPIITPHHHNHSFQKTFLKGKSPSFLQEKRNSDAQKLVESTNSLVGAVRKNSKKFTSSYCHLGSSMRTETQGSMTHREKDSLMKLSREHSKELSTNQINIGQIGHNFHINLDNRRKKVKEPPQGDQSTTSKRLSFINLTKQAAGPPTTQSKDEVNRPSRGSGRLSVAVENFTAFNLRLQKLDKKTQPKLPESKQLVVRSPIQEDESSQHSTDEKPPDSAEARVA